jgi:mannose-6-phosphate isomerase-like protein (cupin superfamily)
MPLPRKIDLAEAFGRIPEPWSPHVAGEVGDCQLKLVKLAGEFVWHVHEHEDELFLVVRGAFTMRLRDGDLELSEGQLVIVPRGVEHCPVARAECWVLLFEPGTTRNTGQHENERTRDVLERL